MGKNVVEVVLRARDLTASALQKFQRRFRAVRRTVMNFTKAVAAGTVALAGMVFGLQRLGEQGDKVLAVKRAFAKITGDETAALEKLRTASKGMVADMQLMSLHNQALALGAADTTQQFADQIEVVNKLARAQGLTLSEGLEKFTVGMARLSKLRLDDLGITLDVEKANEDFARSLGKSADALTDNEKATAFRTAAMRQARELAEQFATSEDGATSATVRFRVAMENLRDKLATFVAESPEVAAFFDGLTGVVSSLAEIVATGDTELLKQAFEQLGVIAGNAFSFGVEKALKAARGFFSNMAEALAPEMSENERRALGEHQGARGIFGLGGGDRRSAFGAVADKIMGALEESSGLAVENIGVAKEALAAIAAEAGRLRMESGGGSGPPPRRDPDPSPSAPITVPGFADNIMFRRDAFSEARQRNRARSARLTPITPFQITSGIEGPGPGVNALPEATKDFEEAGQVVAASMFGMAQAAVRGSDQVAQSVVGMITQIAQSLPGVGGIFGTIIGGVGGLIGAALSRGRRDPVDVRVRDIDDAAARKWQNADQPIRITTVTEVGGVEVERIERELIARQNRDEVVRYSPATGAGVR